MSGSVLTSDAFGTEIEPWGLNDRSPQIVITPATSDAAGLSTFRYQTVRRPHPGIFYVRSTSEQQGELEQASTRIAPCIQKLSEIARLQFGWNSYGARPIAWSAIVATLKLLLGNLPANAPLPQIVPTVRGGIQLEWHTPSTMIEVYIDVYTPDQQTISFFAADSVTGEEFEGPLAGNEGDLKMWISRAR
jgi:hypothetical protein